MPRRYRRTCSLLLRASTLLVSFSSGYSRAFAGSCSYLAGAFTCSGVANSATDTTQNINIALPLTVTTLPLFGINTSISGGDAFSLQTTGSFFTFTDINDSAITGALRGIYARNFGTGDLSISSSGIITGNSGNGIQAYNFLNSTNLAITTAGVTGGTNGIYAQNFGHGAISITTTGTVTGTSTFGIFAYNSFQGAATDLSITAANVIGGQEGIHAANFGSGALSITATGTVTGNSSDGIHTYNSSGSVTGQSITVSAVTGGHDGIYALNGGSGALSITTTGRVTGSGRHGIVAYNTGSAALSITTSGPVIATSGHGIYAGNTSTKGTDVTITAADVTGGQHGIYAFNYGGGSLSVTTTGRVTGTSGDGVLALTKGGESTTITIGALSIVEGGDTGIKVKSLTGQPATINVYGQVRNLSGLNSDDAILAIGAPTTINLFAGSAVTGRITLSDFSDSVHLFGSLNGSIFLNDGNDTFYQVGGSTLTGTADGGAGTDNLGFNDMGTVDGAKYHNFENLGIYGGSTTLTGAWNFATGTATIYEGNLYVDGSLAASLVTVEDGGWLIDNGTVTSTTLDIQSGGVADINDIATIADSTTVGGILKVNSGGQLTTGSLTVNSGGTASVEGTADVTGTTDIFGSLTVDGTLSTSLLTVENGASLVDNGAITSTALDIQSGGVASINGTATIAGATTVGGLLGIPSGGQLTTGSLTVSSGGTANIQGAAVVGGATDILGNLYLDGSLATSQLTVGQDGLLAGNGSVSGNISISGTVSPGHSIGTLHVNGSLSFAPGSTYMVELGDYGSNDLIQVNGSASISGGTIKTSLPIALYTDDQRWHIIETSGGVDGLFSSLEVDTSFTSYTVNLEQQINGDNLDLVIVRTPFASFATTPNEAAVGQALDDLVPSAKGSMADLILTMDFAMDPSQLAATLGGMNPERYVAFPATGLEVAGNFTRMVAMQQEELWPEEGDPLWEVWGQVFGHRLDHDGDDEISGHTLDTVGTVIGMDRSFAMAARAGLMLGNSSSDLSWSDSDSGGGIDGKNITAYGSARLAGFRIDGTVGYTDLGNSAGRILTTPALTGTASADFDSSVWGASLVGTYDFTFAQLTFGPVVSLDYRHLHQQGFSEQGPEDFATQIQSTDADSLISSLGVQLSGVLEKGGWRFLPRTEVALVHQFEENGAALTATFIDYPDATFTVEGAEPENNWLLASLGVTVEFRPNLSLDLDFSTSWADNQNAKLLAGKLIWAF